MKKLEIIIKPEKLESLKNILDDCEASGLMITNIMGYGNQKGYTRMYRGTTYNVNLLPKVKVETVVYGKVQCDQYREFWLLLPYCRLFGEGSGGSDRFLRCCDVPEGKKTRRQAVIMYGHRTACSSENHRRQCRWYCEDLKSTGVQ